MSTHGSRLNDARWAACNTLFNDDSFDAGGIPTMEKLAEVADNAVNAYLKGMEEPCRECVERHGDWRYSMGVYEDRLESEPAPVIRPAEFILWGKLLPPEALGPRCYDHAARQVGHRALNDPSYAIYHLPRIND